MPFSTRMKWPFPREGQDPWFPAFEGFVQAMDASAFASREDRAVTLMKGGTLTFTASTGLLDWSSAIEILAAITGFRWEIAAGSVNLAEGEMMYVDLSRGPTRIVTLTAKTANQVPSSDDALFLCIRRGTKICWRDGFILADGVPADLFESSGIGLDLATGDARYVNVTGDTMTGNLRIDDNVSLLVGSGTDLSITHDTTDSIVTSATGNLLLDNTNVTGLTVVRLGTNDAATAFEIRSDNDTVRLEVNGAGQIGLFGTTPTGQSAAYTRNAVVVEDRTLLASASATTTNNNNVLAALIADLQAIGVLG